MTHLSGPRDRRPVATRHGLARILSKRGVCSRREAALWIAAGRVAVDGRVVRDPEFPIAGEVPISVDGKALAIAQRVYLALNKPRGRVTTTNDEHGRETVYYCLRDAGLPWVAPVGRLDKASEGLLLMSNDPGWAARITDPAVGPDKTYHVQIDRIPDPESRAAQVRGATVDGDVLAAKSAELLRSGQRNAWLEIVLDEGRNRQIRRLLQAFDIGVLRLVRVAIGDVRLGELPKGGWRHLSPTEVAGLAVPTP